MSGILGSAVDSAKNAGNYVSETLQGSTDKVSKEGNKEVAKSSEAPLTDRASSAVSAAGDAISQNSHDAKAEAHKKAI